MKAELPAVGEAGRVEVGWAAEATAVAEAEVLWAEEAVAEGVAVPVAPEERAGLRDLAAREAVAAPEAREE